MKDNALYRAAEKAYEESLRHNTISGLIAPLYSELTEDKQEMWVAYVWTPELDAESYPDG